ncbi:PucR family transcriptional regulator [Leucobacter chromiiresistens]|uniref:PucR family transcriptional regulator n=1 Tax=Leucobacter chromiiresistens TaxID=1079994 RepID=UPI001E34A4EF|nr:helix-turn-helix domain-containing protein [Leucobacter chromiiresistens]
MDTQISPIPVSDGVPLAELLALFEPGIATPLGARDLQHLVRGAEFYDARDAIPDEAGLLLLVPAPQQLSVQHIADLANLAARHAAAGIVVKCSDDHVAALELLAERVGIPCIRIADQVSWRLFDSLLAQALGERRHRDDAHRDRGLEPLFALANELAEYFGGSVAIEDLGRRIIAYSSVPGQLIDRLRTQGILTREVPDSPFNDDQYRTVLRSEDPIKYPRLGDEEPRVAFAIRAGALPLGTIWAIDSSGLPELTAEQGARIREAASLAAAHLLSDIHARRTTHIPREARLRTLLDGSDVTGSELAELGHPEERGSELIVFSPAKDARQTTLAQLRSTVQRHLALHRPESVTVARGDRVYALVARQPLLPATHLVEPLLPVIDRLVGPGTLVSLPGAAYRSGEVAALRQLADRLLDTAERHGGIISRRIVTVDAVRTLLILERVEAVFLSEPELLTPGLVALEAEQALLVETLEAWCANLGNVARTARALSVHENTVRYRMRQIEEQHGIDLSNADVLLTTWLQLRARRIAGKKNPR